MNKLRAISFESRRVKEMAKLIEAQGGEVLSAPALKEVPLQQNAAAIEFGADLLAGRYDVVIFLTGVGTRALFELIEQRHPRAEFVAALARIPTVVRGPKPAGVLREYAVPITVAVPEPNTWRELVAALDTRRDSVPLAGRRVALQEYGAPNPELVSQLEARGARVVRVPVYRWALPDDVAPLRDAIRALVAGHADLALFTNAMQVNNLMQVAEREGLAAPLRDAMRHVAVASIGPTASACLRENGLPVDLEASHGKMGFLVKEAFEAAPRLITAKRGGVRRGRDSPAG